MGHRKLPWSMGRISTSGSLTNVGVVVRHQQIMLREACDHSECEKTFLERAGFTLSEARGGFTLSEARAVLPGKAFSCRSDLMQHQQIHTGRSLVNARNVGKSGTGLLLSKITSPTQEKVSSSTKYVGKPLVTAVFSLIT